MIATILDKILNEIVEYTIRTGKKPNIIKLGKYEMKELKLIVADNLYFPIKCHKMNTVAGLNIIEVNKNNCIECIL